MLKQKIQNDLTKSVKEGNEVASSTLRMLLAAIVNKEKEKKYKTQKEKLTDEEVIEVISSEIKKRKEAITEFEKGERQDLVKKEKAELEVLKKYLPKQLSNEEIKKLAREVIEEVGAKEMKDVGRVMAKLMPKLKGRAEGSEISRIVKKLLSKDDED